ncbi:MAG TPA: ABC transporter substrate-binding protein [Candidatus Binatia bacterium]|nr:ABC transporter substrate-binding protein [Candidatus Binatia bacterium]
MTKLKLTLACGDYDFLRPLFDGSVAPAGIDLNVLTMPSPERHGRMLRHEEFDVCELSLVGYLVGRDRGCAYVAIPVFPHRRFRHSYMVKRTGCGIEHPADLNGKRVALDTLQNSAGLWMRGILQDHYGVDLKTIEWWCQEEEDVPFEPARWMRVKRVPAGKNVDQMLLDGALEAALYPEVLPSIRKGSPEVALLFRDPKTAEIEYFKKSGIFPIMHTVVVKNRILEKNPWVAMSLVQAFQCAKEVCFERMRDPRSFALVWVQELMREQKEIFGSDPWPYNLEENRKALEAVVRYGHEQGMIKDKPEIEDLFFPPSLQRIQHYV